VVVLAVLLGGINTLAAVFAVTGDNIAALITAGLTTVNTVLLLWGQRHLRREVEPKLQEIHTTTEQVQGIVDRRKLQRPDDH